jgi:hypothetical protein
MCRLETVQGQFQHYKRSRQMGDRQETGNGEPVAYDVDCVGESVHTRTSTSTDYGLRTMEYNSHQPSVSDGGSATGTGSCSNGTPYKYYYTSTPHPTFKFIRSSLRSTLSTFVNCGVLRTRYQPNYGVQVRGYGAEYCTPYQTRLPALTSTEPSPQKSKQPPLWSPRHLPDFLAI